jgi:hypothetical protein
MSDFSEIENDLRNLRPAQPSPVLLERIEEGLAGCRASASDARWKRWRFTETPYNWSWASGLAAAAVLILFAAISMQRGQERAKEVAQNSQLSKAIPSGDNLERAITSEKFVPAGATRVVYNTRDEGLHFTDGSHQPLRRVRYQARQTWQWRSTTTGASLRVSYPSEEVVLIPVSGQ